MCDNCYTTYKTISTITKVPTYSKHCQIVKHEKCTDFQHPISVPERESQCKEVFKTKCHPDIQTQYKNECKMVHEDVCALVHDENVGSDHQKEVCMDVMKERCTPVPFKYEKNKCVFIPSQQCGVIPTISSKSVPIKKCSFKPVKVCQTVVSTKSIASTKNKYQKLSARILLILKEKTLIHSSGII